MKTEYWKKERNTQLVCMVGHFPGNAFDPKVAFVRMEAFLRNVTFLQDSDPALMVPAQLLALPGCPDPSTAPKGPGSAQPFCPHPSVLSLLTIFRQCTLQG